MDNTDNTDSRRTSRRHVRAIGAGAGTTQGESALTDKHGETQ